jgi:hypothetical protein
VNLDVAVFDGVEVAQLAGIDDPKLISNWTDRGFCDPYQAATPRRRGRGKARVYSVRDALKLALMKDLSDRYQVPIPLGTRICAKAFETFHPARPGYLIIDRHSDAHLQVLWCGDSAELARQLTGSRAKALLVVNAASPFSEVLARVRVALRAKSQGNSHG